MEFFYFWLGGLIPMWLKEREDMTYVNNADRLLMAIGWPVFLLIQSIVAFIKWLKK